MQESGRIICRILENSVLYSYKHCFFIVPAGRPLKFQSVEELQEKIEEYFSKCKTEGKKPIKDAWYSLFPLLYPLLFNAVTAVPVLPEME